MNHDIQSFLHQCKREWHIYVRQPRIIVNAALFFLMIVVFFPLAMPANHELMHTLAAGLIWIALLFAFFLSGENVFQQEQDDGVIAQWLLSGSPLVTFILAKITVHWSLNISAIIILIPVYALIFGLNLHETLILNCSVIFGSPALITLCILSAAFGLGVKQTGILMALVLFPLTLPIIIFGSASIAAAMNGQEVKGYLALLLAMSLLSLALLPLATAAVVRESVK